MVVLLTVLICAPLGFAFGYYVLGPLMMGWKPFTAPSDFREERRLRRRD